MTFREVVLAIEGLREKDKQHRDWIRRAAFIISASGWNAKHIIAKFDKSLWPIENADKPNLRERAYEQLRKMREADAKNDDLKKVKQIINGRGTSDSSRG